MPAIAQAHVGMTWLLDPTTPRYAMSGFHNKKGRFLGAAAIDARHRTSPRRHDMAAELLVAAAIDARHRSCPRWHDMAASL